MKSKAVKHDSPAVPEMFVMISLVDICSSFTEIKLYQNIWCTYRL